MTRTERLLRLAKLRGDRAAVAIMSSASVNLGRVDNVWRCSICGVPQTADYCHEVSPHWTEAELRAAWGNR